MALDRGDHGDLHGRALDSLLAHYPGNLRACASPNPSCKAVEIDRQNLRFQARDWQRPRNSV